MINGVKVSINNAHLWFYPYIPFNICEAETAKMASGNILEQITNDFCI
jgi:hypothetical protein